MPARGKRIIQNVCLEHEHKHTNTWTHTQVCSVCGPPLFSDGDDSATNNWSSVLSFVLSGRVGSHQVTCTHLHTWSSAFVIKASNCCLPFTSILFVPPFFFLPPPPHLSLSLLPSAFSYVYRPPFSVTFPNNNQIPPPPPPPSQHSPGELPFFFVLNI